MKLRGRERGEKIEERRGEKRREGDGYKWKGVKRETRVKMKEKNGKKGKDEDEIEREREKHF